jgi:iron complex outermembrane receptor protein
VQRSVAATIDKDGNVLSAVSNGGIIFRWRDQLTLDWKYKKVGLSLTNNFQSGYWDAYRADAEEPVAQHVGAFSTWDLQGTYSGIKNLTLTAGVKNLFNRKPTEVITGGSYFQTGYDPTWYDPHGQTGYVSGFFSLAPAYRLALKIFFGSIACTPTLPSTSWVISMSTATLDSM